MFEQVIGKTSEFTMETVEKLTGDNNGIIASIEFTMGVATAKVYGDKSTDTRKAVRKLIREALLEQNK